MDFDKIRERKIKEAYERVEAFEGSSDHYLCICCNKYFTKKEYIEHIPTKVNNFYTDEKIKKDIEKKRQRYRNYYYNNREEILEKRKQQTLEKFLNRPKT
jgi:hypothetical protein